MALRQHCDNPQCEASIEVAADSEIDESYTWFRVSIGDAEFDACSSPCAIKVIEVKGTSASLAAHLTYMDAMDLLEEAADSSDASPLDDAAILNVAIEEVTYDNPDAAEE